MTRKKEKKVRKISGNEYPRECYFFKELLGAQSDRDSMVLSKVMQKHCLISSRPRKVKLVALG